MRERTPEGSSAAGKPARAAAPPSAATPAARVLALQRSHGNRAVTRLLARQPGVRTPKQMFEEDVTARKWDRALSALGTLDKSQIGPALGFLTPDQLRHLDDEATREGMSSSGTVRAGIGKALVGQGVTKEHAKSGRGFGKASAKYGKITSGKKNATDYSVEISLDFKPDPAAVAADEITWIQTVRTVDTATGALNEPRPEFSSRATPSSWMLDRMEGRTHGWYGFADDASAQNNVRPWRRAAPKTSAWMWDQPAWDVPNMTWEFEAAAVCRTGSADTAMRKGDKPGFVYAVVTWGFDTGAHGEVKTHKIKVWNKPTDEFGEAVGLWNAQARNELATMNAPGQQQLPAVQ